jgi:hypothetical protein
MADESRAYQAWVRTLPCLGCGRDPGGEIHHVGRKGTSQRSHDSCGVPLCRECHQAMEDLHGPFRGFRREHRKAWERMAVTNTRGRARYAGWRWRENGRAYRMREAPAHEEAF